MYWTPIKDKTGRYCSVCSRRFVVGFESIEGQFVCAKDKALKDNAEISVNRISVWAAKDIPHLIQMEIMSQMPDVDMRYLDYVILYPPELVIENTYPLSSLFDRKAEIPSSKGILHLVSEKFCE